MSSPVPATLCSSSVSSRSVLARRCSAIRLRWLRDHCKMVAIPTLAQEDAKRPNRERESLVGEQSRIVTG
jgi:hypothetical protein